MLLSVMVGVYSEEVLGVDNEAGGVVQLVRCQSVIYMGNVHRGVARNLQLTMSSPSL